MVQQKPDCHAKTSACSKHVHVRLTGMFHVGYSKITHITEPGKATEPQKKRFTEWVWSLLFIIFGHKQFTLIKSEDVR